MIVIIGGPSSGWRRMAVCGGYLDSAAAPFPAVPAPAFRCGWYGRAVLDGPALDERAMGERASSWCRRRSCGTILATGVVVRPGAAGALPGRPLINRTCLMTADLDRARGMIHGGRPLPASISRDCAQRHAERPESSATHVLCTFPCRRPCVSFGVCACRELQIRQQGGQQRAGRDLAGRRGWGPTSGRHVNPCPRSVKAV